MSAEKVERVFRNATTWQDDDLAVSVADLTECVDEDGDPDVDKIYGEAHRLVTERPYLKGPKGSLGSDVPHGPTAPLVGSGRRRYGQPALDESTLRRKYPALNA
ncbi:hypothetical protein JNB_04650 [Janibacter sp. HTCC2649]|uniref:hypothetical protein n=1 Tax=Janibacter sp. HTCC2649 TaxID=313589 RepID=UPI000066ED0B|nr:hypothetical protein [Janibacter sp. HTCC2649]EAP99432.1 hypothetical protein JNB_04650 [Janibacter sp. HTCC2649]